MCFRMNIRMGCVAILAMAMIEPLSGGANSSALAEAPKGDAESEFPPFAEVTKDMKVHEGFITLYHNEKTDQLLAKIPMAMMDKHFLAATSIAGGRDFAGWQWGDGVVYWQRFNKKLILNLADPRYAKGDGSTVADVIGRTYPDAIGAALDIMTESPNGDPVIDLGSLLKSDLAEVGMLFGGQINSGISRMEKIKVFPNNVELTVNLAIGTPSGSGAMERAAVHYSFSNLPETKYQPRAADDRIGYFMVVNQDWSKPHEDKTVFNRYITRWWLQPEDPTAEVSDVKPENQIVFYIEKTVPIEYRPYVREGILEWNKAFEKAGLRNAMRVIQQTDNDPETRDLDPEDVRYNFIRWIVSGVPYAMGPSRAHPFTGQILDADIVFDDAMVRYLVNEYKTLGPRSDALYESSDLRAFWDAHPEWRLAPLTENWMPEALSDLSLYGIDSAPQRLNLETQRRLEGIGKSTCDYGTGVVRQLAVAHAQVAQGGVPALSKEFIGQVIKEIVAHEVGHTLGLRHNFKASTWKSHSEVLSSSDPNEPTVGSVMDYNPSIFAVSERDQGNFVTPAIGPYDYWAIEYGYRVPKEDAKEADLLKAITDRVADAGLAYATDEDTMFFSPDPLSNRFDFGSDPLDFARDRVQLYERLMKDVAQWGVDDGDSWYRLRRAVDMLLGEYSFGVQVASRLIGGQYVNRDHKGDPDARTPFEIVPVATQRAALQLLERTVFSPSAFDFSPELLNRIGAGRWWHWNSDAMDMTVEYEIHDRILGIQAMVLFRLINPINLNRIYDGELKVPADQDALTVPELLNHTCEMIWAELKSGSPQGDFTNRKPMINSFRRNLQRFHIEMLTSLALYGGETGLNADSSATAMMTLRDLKTRIDNLLETSGRGLDDATRAHLQDGSRRIQSALEAKYRLN